MRQTRHPDAVWDSIRDDYLLGETQPRLAERYNVGVSTIRDRARRGAWRRADQPEPDLPPLDPPDPVGLDEAGVMRPVLTAIADAYRQADVALRRGRAVEAHRLLHVARGFERLWYRHDELTDALNEQWRGEADAWDLRHSQPPWPRGVYSAQQALAELPRVEAAFTAALDAGERDIDALAELIERRDRLRACLALIEVDDDEPSARPADPPDPPDPPCASNGGSTVAPEIKSLSGPPPGWGRSSDRAVSGSAISRAGRRLPFHRAADAVLDAGVVVGWASHATAGGSARW